MTMCESKGRETTSVWDKLPEEVAESVFALLPVSSVLHCRCVCKKWSLILSSNNFLNLWGRMSPPQTSCFLVYRDSLGVEVYNPISNTWNNFPVCSLDPHQVFFVQSAGGLLCFRNYFKNTFTIFNPVTKRQRVLPGLLQIGNIHIVGMVADKSSNSYKILATGRTKVTDSTTITEVYDSLTGCWVHHCSSERKFFFQATFEEQAMWCKGSFYYLTVPDYNSTTYGIAAYNMLQRGWRDLDVQMPSENLRRPSLLACQGRLLLAGLIFIGTSLKSFLIWELDWDTLKWREIASMPSTILSKIHYYVALQYCGNTDLICFTAGHFIRHSVTDDLLQKTWYWISDNTIDKRHEDAFGMSFEPNLVANV